jgi:hypothetical protein
MKKILGIVVLTTISLISFSQKYFTKDGSIRFLLRCENGKNRSNKQQSNLRS